MAYVKGQPFLPQFADPATGLLMTSGTIEFYLTGTSTPTPYYTDSAGTAGGTSLTLNSGGKPATDIYFDTAVTYKIVVKNAAGTVLDAIDPYVADPGATLRADLAAAGGAGLVGTSLSETVEAILLASSTYAEKTWYVSTTGDDSTGDGSVGNPFATLQAAWDAMPTIIRHQQTIQLADGTYSSSTIAAVDQPRPAILWGRGKVTTFRSWVASSAINAPIVIQGNPTDASLVKIVNVGDYKYNTYINKGNVGFQNLSIESGVAGTSALVVAHRTDTFIHLYNCIVDGQNTTTSCMNAESSGQIEYVQGTQGKIRNATTGVQTLSAGDSITIASQGSSVITGCGTGAVAVNNSYIGLFSAQPGNGKVEVIDSTCTLGINATLGAVVQVRGADFGTDMAQIGAPCQIESGSHIEFIFAESLTSVAVKNATVKYNASNYADYILGYNASIHLETSNSYVSPATANVNSRPIQLLDGSKIYREGTNNINGSTGIAYPSVFPSILTATADNQVLTPIANRSSALRISSSAGGPWVGCEIDSTGAYEGQMLYVSYYETNTNNVQLIGTGTHMLFTNPILIGKGVGDYTGATFQMVNGKWRLVGLGQLIV